MDLDLQAVIEAVHALSLSDKLEVLQAISEDLNRVYALEAASAAFWSPKTTEELAGAQSARVITDVRALAMGSWPEDETAEEVNRFVAEQRHRERLQEAWIAATALHHSLPLVTHNPSDFQYVDGLDVRSILPS